MEEKSRGRSTRGGPADDPSGMQVQYHSQIQPTLSCPNIADVASLFLVWRICHEVTIQQIGRDVELVIAVPLSAGCSAIACRAMVVTLCLRVRTTDMQFWRVHCLVVAACSDERETANTTMANIQTNFLQLFGHARPVMAARLRRDCTLICASVIRSDRCLRLAGRLRKARRPRELTCITWHIRCMENVVWCSSMNLNLTDFDPQEILWPL